MGNVLILAPHTDDGELGSGGTIARLVQEGHCVFYIAFSICEESIPAGFPPNALELEERAASALVGVLPENLIIRNYPVRRFNSYRQEILEELVQLRKEIAPEMVFMPCSSSIHQDHQVIYEEGLRAFKHTSCYGYELPWDTNHFATSAFFVLQEAHIKLKADAVDLYKTQQYRSYADREFVFGLARVRGAQVNVQYAEAFEALRVVN